MPERMIGLLPRCDEPDGETVFRLLLSCCCCCCDVGARLLKSCVLLRIGSGVPFSGLLRDGTRIASADNEEDAFELGLCCGVGTC